MPSVTEYLHGAGSEVHGESAELADILGEELAPGQESLTCGATTILVMEMGKTNVRCTLPLHEGLKHYDGAFLCEWEDLE